jgi:hypothetical protein
MGAAPAMEPKAPLVKKTMAKAMHSCCVKRMVKMCTGYYQ